MKLRLLTLLAILSLLAACKSTTPTPTTEPSPVGMPNPASVYCEEQGGQLEIRTADDGSQTGYCLFPDGSECEEWAYFRGECAPGGASGVGMPNPASQYCEEQGGRLEIRTAEDGSQSGYCIFADGSECEEWAYFRGECAPGGTSAVPIDELLDLVWTTVPANAFSDLAVLPLQAPAGSPRLWAVFSTGLLNYELEPLPNHLVAIYTHDDAGWQELARYNLLDSSDPMAPPAPGYLDVGGVSQVLIDPARVLIALSGGVGAHGGTFHLLSFDGAELRAEVAASASFPAFDSLVDLNGDGVLDVLLDQSDAYVFCYACGVRKLQYTAFYWDSSNQTMFQASIEPFLMGQPQPMRDLVNPAVALANAGLWKDALPLITQAVELAPQYPECDMRTLEWDDALIRLHAERMAEYESPYPLLDRVFYGDYAAAVDMMRAYGPEEIFAGHTPLIVGTAAEGLTESVSNYIIASADAALAVQPELAPAYFLRGWAGYLLDPTSAQARADVAQAAALAPDDALFAASAAYLP